MLTMVITFLLPVVTVAAAVRMIIAGRENSGGETASPKRVPPQALLPAAVFTLAACVLVIGFRVLYPLTAECRYWMEEGWGAIWWEAPDNRLWDTTVWLAGIALVIFGGVVVPLLTVKRISADGVFSSGRYVMAILLTESSMVIPLALYAAIFRDNPFSWLRMMPAAEVWCWCRLLAVSVMTFTAERAWRSVHPGGRKPGRTFSVLGLLLSYVLLTCGGFCMVKNTIGEYISCPCELEGLVSAGLLMILMSLVVAAAILYIPMAVGRVLRLSRMTREEKR